MTTTFLIAVSNGLAIMPKPKDTFVTDMFTDEDGYFDMGDAFSRAVDYET